jgi:co-chaperonin GroES (HSP10)
VTTGERHVFDDIQAISDVTIAEMLDPEKNTKGGLILPDTVAKSPIWWKVISVGPKVTDVKVGQRILFSANVPRIEHEGRTIISLKPDHIIGTLPPPKEAVVERVFDPTRY